MMNKSVNLTFLTIMIMGIILSVSSNSWFSVWMGMEMNLMAFMPMILQKNNMLSKESAMTYFMVQAVASMLLMVFMITMPSLNFYNMKPIMLMSILMMKSGITPFHFWLPKLMEGLNWNMCLILMTIQKITPMMMMSSLIKMNIFTMMVMITSVMVGAIGGLNQTSLRKMMGYSSISNNGWMMAAMMMSEMTWFYYFMIYSIMTVIMTKTMDNYNIFHMNQIFMMKEPLIKKMIMMMNMLSISGLPPFIGFLPKWIVIQSSLNYMNLTLIASMVMMTLITIYYYLRVMYSTMMITYSEPFWVNIMSKNSNLLMMYSTLSIIGLTMMTMLMWLY
uniref:NADH-ubiquinone oxidoreductase chain 2 n=1 Tax=Megalophasma granulatum TaxID=2042296 RepID=A0A343KJS5_9NEOP|nr:NADH dehydrogenase subunit 2 [Megalophasma granulatum]